MSATFPTETALDHLVYATPDLKRSVHELAQKLGIEPSEGGRHVGRGTMNYLLGLGGGTYLELIGSDPDQRDFTGTRPFGLDSLSEPRLVSWAVQVNDIETFVRRLEGEGYDPGPISEMSRQTPEGQTLQWKLTRTQGALPTLVPFLIDWGATPHPSRNLAPGAKLEDFHVETADRGSMEHALKRMGVTYRVETSSRECLIADIAGPLGTVTLT